MVAGFGVCNAEGFVAFATLDSQQRRAMIDSIAAKLALSTYELTAKSIRMSVCG